MPRKIAKSHVKTHSRAAARAMAGSPVKVAPPTVSGRWILGAVAGVVAAAAMCVWLVLCLLFWQGSWQLLYHPSAIVAKTPASVSLAFDPIGFAATGDGIPQLSGWWVPAAADSHYRRYTVLYLHGQDGNLGDTIPALARLHEAGVNVFAFDYRGYGQSKFARPSEARWLEDAGWALEYLTGTRHIDPDTIVAYGNGLGANLALEFAAGHRELAGVAADSPLNDALTPIFGDARAELVPAHLLVRDRYDLKAAANRLRIPALWIETDSPEAHHGYNDEPAAYREITSHKSLVWLNPATNADQDRAAAFARWLDDLAPSH
ncbi:MAG TPA: alpha/beta fold hydrolase [Terracidiphilus sp.]|nr:alpha/beta fold hydrolase [Terracidiphilus sp.]